MPARREWSLVIGLSGYLALNEVAVAGKFSFDLKFKCISKSRAAQGSRPYAPDGKENMRMEGLDHETTLREAMSRRLVHNGDARAVRNNCTGNGRHRDLE